MEFPETSGAVTGSSLRPEPRLKAEYFFWAAVLLAFLLFLDAPQAKVSHLPDDTASVAAAGADAYGTVSLAAKAAFVYDATLKRPLYEYHADDVLPLASLAKVMTAATALAVAPETTLVTIDAESIKTEGDSGLRVGEVWMLRDLLKFMLVQSSNDAAAAVARSVGAAAADGGGSGGDGHAAFIAAMNRLARSFQLSHATFYNETGLDMENGRAGAVGTARDAALLLARTLRESGSIFAATTWNELFVRNEDGTGHSATNTNRYTERFPLLLASKTGYTDIAGGNLLIAFDAGFNHPIIVSVLGSSREGRFTDAEQLVWATLDYLSRSTQK